jgi:hypothetical protein
VGATCKFGLARAGPVRVRFPFLILFYLFITFDLELQMNSNQIRMFSKIQSNILKQQDHTFEVKTSFHQNFITLAKRA